MIGSSRNLRVYVYTRPADMRLGFDGLFALILNRLQRNPLCGDIFLFVGKDRRRAKALMWDGTGILLSYKRLERGLFADVFKDDIGPCQLTMSELQLFLEGSRFVGTMRLSPDELKLNIVV